jgi:TRAP-type C4-dicarboxylate transport system permease small subunit
MFAKIEEFFVGIGLMLLIALVFVAAVLRFFGIDMSWSTDSAQLTFAWVCFIGTDLAFQKNKHMGVDMLVNKFSKKTQNSILLFNNILAGCFLIIIVVYGFNLAYVNFQRSFQTLPISYSYVTLSAPVGCALMLITVGKNIYKLWRNIGRNDYSDLLKKKDEGGDIL